MINILAVLRGLRKRDEGELDLHQRAAPLGRPQCMGYLIRLLIAYADREERLKTKLGSTVGRPQNAVGTPPADRDPQNCSDLEV